MKKLTSLELRISMVLLLTIKFKNMIAFLVHLVGINEDILSKDFG